MISHDEMMNIIATEAVESGLSAPTGSAPVPYGEYWCVRPGKAPALCLIRRVQDETPSGEPLEKTAIRFLASGADFYFERWRELYATDAQFVPVPQPNPQ